MKLVKIGLFSVLAALITGCGYNVKINVKHAPELTLIGVKQVNVEPFKVSGNVSLDIADTGGGLLGAVAGIALDVGANKLAEGKNQSIQEAHNRGVRDAITRDGYYKVNVANDFDAKISGNLTYSVKDDMETVTNKDQAGKVTTSYLLKRNAAVSVRFDVADKGGTIIGNSSIDSSLEKSWSGASKSAARSSAQDWDAMVREAIDKSHPAFVRKIAPYFVLETRELEKGDSDLIKEGNKAAEKSDWKTAVSLWNQGLNTGKDVDRVAATYNLAVYDEVEGKLEDALKKFEDVFNSTHKSRHGSDVARIKSRIDEENRLKKADAARKS